MDLNEKYQYAGAKLKSAKNILIIGHVNPDGDALASISALRLVAEDFNIPVQGAALSKRGVSFGLPGEDEIVDQIENLEPLESFEVMIIVDCGSLRRTGLEAEILNLKQVAANRPYIIEIDHHPKVDDYADLEIRLPEKSATAEIIYELFKSNDWPLSKLVANCVLTGLLADTGNFLYPNVSDQTVLVAAETLQAGAQLTKIINNLRRNKNLLTMKLWGRAMDNLKMNKSYNLAISVLSYQEIKDISDNFNLSENYSLGDIFGDIAGFLSNLAGVKAILLLREDEVGQIKGSLRTSQATVDISPLARLLGGGGHPKASGFSMAGHIVETANGRQIIT
jgi:phosphoesterase RecJ-like protein